MSKHSKRISLTSEKLRHLEPNLIDSHLRSYDLLLKEGISEVFAEINPITDYTGESWELKFAEISWGPATTTFRQAQKLGLSYDKPMFVEVKLTNKKTGEIKKQKIFVGSNFKMRYNCITQLNDHLWLNSAKFC